MRNRVTKILMVGGLVSALCVVVTQFVGKSFAIDNSLQAKGGLTEPDLVVSWPENTYSGDPAVTFRIPREYLHQGTTWIEKDGSIKSFAVEFELPGPIPVQERPWLKGKKGAPEYEEFMKTWQGRFSMDVGRYTSGGAGKRTSMRNRALSSSRLVRDVNFAGLERYSRVVCYEKSYLKEHKEAREFLAGKESDDGSLENCRLDRRIADFFSPLEVTADEEGVAINCMNSGCKAYFNVSGRGVAMGISHKDVDNWPRIVEPARNLIRSFVVKQNSK